MEEDVQQGVGLEMTTDRDRVEVALRAYWGADDLDDTCSENWFREKRARMSRALAAADALAPPVPLDREAVARIIDPGAWLDPEYEVFRQRSLEKAAAVLALLPAAPLPVPDDVRRAHSRWEAAIADGCSGATISNAHENFLRTAAAWVRTLLASHAEPEGTMAETQATINAWIAETFGEAGSNLSVAARTNEEMAELMMALAVDDRHPKTVEECADIVIILYRLAERMGQDLHAAVATKMAVNRARKWAVANGHGYHLKAENQP